jgi:hypothetical protein
MGTIKILEGVEKNDGTKPMSEMEPLEVAEIVGDCPCGFCSARNGDIVFRAGTYERSVFLNLSNDEISWGMDETKWPEVRPLTKPITIEISND